MADPFSALADIVIGVYKERKLQAWVSLIFQMVVSVIGTFNFVVGSTLLTAYKLTNSLAIAWTVAIAHGLIWNAVVIGVFVRKSPLLKGMMFVFPQEEAKEEMNSDMQVITRNK